MARIQIPIDVLTSRLNIQDRISSFRSGSIASRFANLRPISEFFDVKRLSKPANFGEAQSRVNYNLGYFSSNYAVVFVMLFLYALLTNIWLLFDIIFVVAGMFLIGKLEGRDLEIGQQRFTTSQLYTALYVIAIPIGLIASPFSTLMWLIGASGVVIIGHAALMDKPIDEAFSGEAGRPSKRDRRTHPAHHWENDRAVWDEGGRVVEELEESEDDDDDSSDSHGAGLALGHRTASDPLHSTGTGFGERDDGVGARYRLGYRDDDDDEEDSEESSEQESEEELARLALTPEELATIEKALAKVRKAQTKGKKNVKLKTEEYAALMKRKELKDALGRRKNEITAPIEDVLPKHPSPEQLRESQRAREPDRAPPMGYFPPSSSRPRSGTASTSSRPPSRSTNKERRASPFRYSYVHPSHPAPPPRHVSDPAASRPLSRSAFPQDAGWAPNVYGVPMPPASASSGSRRASQASQGTFDPYQYMGAVNPASYHNGGPPASPARRHVSGSQNDVRASVHGASSPRPRHKRSGHRTRSQRVSSDEDNGAYTREDEEEDGSESTSDDFNQGARIDTSAGNRGRTRAEVMVAEESPEPEPEPRRTRTRSSQPAAKASSHSTSPVKRKPVGGGSGSGNAGGGSRRRKR